jgi:MtrB/PioB family decaheme-associated outer membrane protein
MRITRLTWTAALLLFATSAIAQTPVPPFPMQPPAATDVAQTPAAPGVIGGTADFGGLFTTTDGDAARFERYRDTRDGVYSNFTLHRAGTASLFDAAAYHVGYRDQRYSASVAAKRLTASFTFTGLPLNYSYLTTTPFTINGSVLTLDDAAQRAVQGATTSTTDGTAVGVPCAPGAPPASCSNPTQAAQAKANRSIYNSLAVPIDMRVTRNNAQVTADYAATRAVDIDGSFLSSFRKGEQPWGASFAFNNAVDVPQPIDQRTNDVKLGASWRNDRASVRVGWDGSYFHNAFQSLTFDNPNFLTDFNNGLAPPNGPYDPSGYSNGNGAAHGREALAPSNNMSVVSTTALYKIAAHTTVNGTLQLTQQNQDAALIPWTSNPLILDNPAVIAEFPHLAQLPRSTAEASAKGLNALVNLSARPYRRVNLTVRYRYNKRDVQTPIFDATQYVRFDANPSEDEAGFSPQFDNSRATFDASASFTPAGWGTIRLGYGHEQIHREGRGFADVGEHTFRASYDAYSNRYVTIRTSLDVGRRRGDGFVDAASGSEDTDVAVGAGGTQPTLRYYDEADRNRTRGTVIATVMPRDTLDFFVQFSGGKDTFLPDNFAPVSRPGELFGLQDQSVSTLTLGLNLHPTDAIALGASYGRERFGSFQRSRNASPPPDPTWTDPSRDWTLDNSDGVNTVNAYVDLNRVFRNTDIRFAYDHSDSDNSFVHGGPRIDSLTAAGQFIPLPNVTNSWHRATADVQYFFNPRTGVALGYYFEKLAVTDYDTIDSNGPVAFAGATGVPRIDWLGELMTGYGNRPYTGSTVFVRLLYRF